MTYRRTLVSFSLALASITAGCRYLRPIDPNAPRPGKEAPPTEAVAQPTEQPAAQPPVAQPPVAQPPVAQPPAQQPAAQQPAAQQPTSTQPAQQTPPPSIQPAPQPQPEPQVVALRRPGNLRDGNIAAMVLASNNTDISYARLVPSRAQREDVMKFAERMLTDHTGVNALVTDLLRRLDLAPEENTASLDLRDESANRRDILRELSGFTFDSAYMENEVAYHRQFLASIDNVMAPAARNGELKNHLLVLRPAVAAHLAHAEQTRANVLAKK